MKRPLSSIISEEAKQFALYTVENRAIPNMIDGLKPVHRFLLYRAIEMSKGNPQKFHKLASIAGGVSDAGYHHAETAAQDAGVLLASTWNNNLPILDGQGNFGSRLVQESAQARYIFCRLSENYKKVFKDTEIAPIHPDNEHKPPLFYLPIIPYVLMNGTEGVATGFRTRILPHSFASVVECTKLALDGKLDKEPLISYPNFKGTIERKEGGCLLHGTYTLKGRTLLEITEIPFGFDRAEYVGEVLDDLEDKNMISYEDHCSEEGFHFKVKLKKEFGLPLDSSKIHEYIMKKFKLTESKSLELKVIDENGRLRIYDKASDLIKDFVEVRKKYVQKRIDYMINKKSEELASAKAKANFIDLVVDGTIIVHKKTKKQLIDQIVVHDGLKDYVNDLISLNVYHMTSDEAKKLHSKANEISKEVKYWEKTTAVVEYQKDLNELL